MSFYSSNQESWYNTDANWTFISEKVDQLFKNKKLKELQLSKISRCLMELVGHENDITLSLEYKNTLMRDGMLCLLGNLKNLDKNRGADLLYHLGELWLEFMREIIPTLQLIFANIKHLNDKGHNVERITLEQFRDEVVLCTDIEIVINEVVKSGEFEIPRSVIQMLLILGNLANTNIDKSSKNQERICNLCSLVVIPYINPFDTI